MECRPEINSVTECEKIFYLNLYQKKSLTEKTTQNIQYRRTEPACNTTHKKTYMKQKDYDKIE